MHTRIPQLWKDLSTDGDATYEELHDVAHMVMSINTQSKVYYQMLQDSHTNLPDSALRFWEKELITDEQWIAFFNRNKELKRTKHKSFFLLFVIKLFLLTLCMVILVHQIGVDCVLFRRLMSIYIGDVPTPKRCGNMFLHKCKVLV